MRRYLVVGVGKSGTTAISKTIQNTTGIQHYALEPKKVSFFENLSATSEDIVVKILFDQWAPRPRILNGILANEMNTDFQNVVFITRDPRAQLISKLHFSAYGYFSTHEATDEDAERWLDIFKRKEADPESLSFANMMDYLRQNFDVHKVPPIQTVASINNRFANLVKQSQPAGKIVVSYEDFTAGRCDHPILAGSTDVGNLHFTKRSGGKDDWTAFFLPSDHEEMHKWLDTSTESLGYDVTIPPPGVIDPAKSSGYVERVIKDGRALFQKKKTI